MEVWTDVFWRVVDMSFMSFRKTPHRVFSQQPINSNRIHYEGCMEINMLQVKRRVLVTVAR